MDTKRTLQRSVLALTDETLISVSRVVNAARGDANDGVEQCDPQVITQASSLSKLPAEPSSVDIVVSICSSLEFPGDLLVKEIFRVLKPGGTILIYNSQQSVIGETDKAISGLQRKLLLAGFSEVEALQPKSVGLSNAIRSFGIQAKKPSWNIGSSFALKKSIKSSVKVQIDDDSDLIDEDSLLTEEDLKKPQPPLVGSTRKACKNCTCGRAEAEETVKLGLTTDQSACGSCWLGDAFRCSTCPYKGLPPFKLGEKVSLSENFLVADI
uniref:Anamorsin homolog n=1 Tax=Populus trichocarpa TaxID=3694 RepID=A0A3N7EHD2_POPTR|eukprot:XP_024451207.1 anamorsin homolog isoform X1 [Populus trichocarpa]